MAYTLHVDGGNFRAFKILVAAELNEVNIAVPHFVPGTDNTTSEFLAKSPMGRLPVLDTPSGSLFESNAIARHVAGLKPENELLGANFFDQAKVDSWMDFCNHEIEFPASVWLYPAFGFMPANETASDKARKDLSTALAVLERQLAGHKFLVGDKMTIADITIVSALVYPFKFVCDADFRKPFPSVVAWFESCVALKAFSNVVGTFNLCVDELEVGAAKVVAPKAKQEKKPKEEKKKAPKADKPKKEKKEEEEVDETPKEVKKEHPFKIMDGEKKSPFIMDAWKKTYSNEKGDYTGSMKYFWDNYDAEGWSIWRGDYLWDEENKVLFMTSNLINGFIQRTEEIRKWLFGTLTIRGDESGLMKVTGYFLIRGQEIQPLIDCNDDAEQYKWTKVEEVNEDTKKMLYDYWCSEGPLDGEACLDSRVYK